MCQYLPDKRNLHVTGTIFCKAYDTCFLANSDIFFIFQTPCYLFDEIIGKADNILPAAIILKKIILRCAIICDQFFHVCGIGSAERKNILIVIADGNHAHIFILPHQSFDQRKVIFAHVLRFVDNDNCFCNTPLLDFTQTDHFGSVMNDGV